MDVTTFTCNPFQTNGYICSSQGEAVIIDPSCATEQEQEAVLEAIETSGLEVVHLLLTHAHIDHIFGCRAMEEAFNDVFKAHRDSVRFMKRAEDQAKAFGVTIEPPTPPETFLEEGDTITFGDVTLDVLHTPGHSPDSLCFVERGGTQAITGDVLFQRSIGRTEGLPETSYSQLMTSITEKLLALDDDVTIYPGHGPTTTIGEERRANPFIQDALGS